jgi:hypothetical protein
MQLDATVAVFIRLFRQMEIFLLTLQKPTKWTILGHRSPLTREWSDPTGRNLP